MDSPYGQAMSSSSVPSTGRGSAMAGQPSASPITTTRMAASIASWIASSRGYGTTPEYHSAIGGSQAGAHRDTIAWPATRRAKAPVEERQDRAAVIG